MSLIRSVAGVFRRASIFPDDGTARQRVYTAGDTDAGASGWPGKIVAMSDGRSVAEIVAAIYLDELTSGAWAADIGVWNQLFAERVIEVIDHLAAQGSIRVEPDK